MTTTPDVRATLRRDPIERRFVELDVTGVAEEYDSHGRVFTPMRLALAYQRHMVHADDGEWGPWVADVRIHGPRILKGGRVSTRNSLTARYRTAGEPDTPFSRPMPDWVGRLVDDWSPAGDAVTFRP